MISIFIYIVWILFAFVFAYETRMAYQTITDKVREKQKKLRFPAMLLGIILIILKIWLLATNFSTLTLSSLLFLIGVIIMSSRQVEPTFAEGNPKKICWIRNILFIFVLV